MAARTVGECVPVFGLFHQKCGDKVELSKGRRVASSRTYSAFNPFPQPPIAFSNDPIPKGAHFSVKVLQEDKGYFQELVIGVTTKDPHSGPVPRWWGGIDSSDQYWYVLIRSDDCTAWNKGQKRVLRWVLDRSAGNTFGCHVSGTGELHLHHNGRDVGVAREGLPTDQPLWGFVVLAGYKVEANYVIAQSHPQGPSGSDQTNVGARSNGEPPEPQPKPQPPQPSPSPPVSREGDGALYQEVTAEDVLDFFRDSFIKWTDANTVLYELRHRKIISDGDLTEIKRNPDPKQQNEILHRCLTRSCDEEALMEVCDMMIAVDGNRRMNTLGRKMKCKLEGN